MATKYYSCYVEIYIDTLLAVNTTVSLVEMGSIPLHWLVGSNVLGFNQGTVLNTTVYTVFSNKKFSLFNQRD